MTLTAVPYFTDLVIQDTTEIAVEFGFEKNYLSIKASENISLTVRGKVHAFIDETVSTKWYFNGDTTLRPGATMGPLKRPLLSISQNMEIANTNHLDSGFYEVALTINTYTHLVSHLECPLQYNSFVVNTIGISDIVLARDTIQIVQSGKKISLTKYRCYHNNNYNRRDDLLLMFCSARFCFSNRTHYSRKHNYIQNIKCVFSCWWCTGWYYCCTPSIRDYSHHSMVRSSMHIVGN